MSKMVNILLSYKCQQVNFVYIDKLNLRRIFFLKRIILMFDCLVDLVKNKNLVMSQQPEFIITTSGFSDSAFISSQIEIK